MNLILVHGSHFEKSREKLFDIIKQAKEKGFSIERYNELDLFNIKVLLNEQSLFNNKRLIVIRNYKKLNKNNLKAIADISDDKISIVFYFDERVGEEISNNKAYFKSIYEYEIDKYIFKFLESLYPGNSRSCLKLFKQTIEREKVEFVFFVLAKHIRDLIWVIKSPSTIPYPSWRVSKLEYQAKKFSYTKLKNILNYLSDTDYMVKSSNLTLEDSIDFLITAKLE